MTRIGLVCVLLVIVGLVGGLRWQLAQRPPPDPPRSPLCAECDVVEVDLHVHTRFSDGFLSPMEVVLFAEREGLEAVAITEHNLVFPAKMARWFSALVDGPIILTGQEVTSRDYHLIVVGIRERIAPQRDLSVVLAEVHRQGGVAIAAHPTKRYQTTFAAVRADLDAAEVLHPAAFNESSSFSWQEMVGFYEQDGKNLTAVGSSDFHFFRTLGVCRTEVLVKERTADAILEALKRGDTRVTAPDGRRFGRWRGDEPRVERAPSGYAPGDAFDAISRVLGWLGVLGLVLFRFRG